MQRGCKVQGGSALGSPLLGGAQGAQQKEGRISRGERLPPSPGLPGTSLQPGGTCKVLPVETRFSKLGPVPGLLPELVLKSLGITWHQENLASVCACPEGAEPGVPLLEKTAFSTEKSHQTLHRLLRAVVEFPLPGEI